MRVPSVDRLLAAFPSLTPREAKLIRAIGKAADMPSDGDPLENLIEMHLPKTAQYVNSMHNSPYDSHMWRVTVALHGMNEVMGTYGVEALGPDIGGMSPPPYEYLNTGDTYATTLIYRRRDDSINIGSWGDIAERHPSW